MIIAPFYQFNPAASTPPPSGSTNYIAWEFENGLTDAAGNLTWIQRNVSSVNYPTGIVGKCLKYTGNGGNSVAWSISDPGEEFLIDLTEPFAISHWINHNGTFSAPVLALKDVDSIDRNSDLIWRFGTYQDAVFFGIATDGSDTINVGTGGQYFGVPYRNVWRFVYCRYDPPANPSDPKVVYLGTNDEPERTQTFTVTPHFTSYDPAYSLHFVQSDGGLIYNLDQLVFWRESKTRQDMLDLYNNGNGVSL